MRRSRRNLLPPLGEIFPAGEHGKKCKQDVQDDSDSSAELFERDHYAKAEWSAFVEQCEAFVRSVGCKASPRLVDAVALRLADLVNNSYQAGLRKAAILQSSKARAAKRRKADERGRLIRRAILSVCEQQKVKLVASEKFAASIRSEVIETAMEIGLTNPSAGTSPPSIRRHIAALLKDAGMR